MKAPVMFILGAAYASSWWAAAMWPTVVYTSKTDPAGEVGVSPLWILPSLATAGLLLAGARYAFEKWDD